jgi:hypothetical protein
VPRRRISSILMAETEFGVTYDGPALAEGAMPVRDLAPALLALGELFTEASLVTYPEREPASLNIRATSKGSFIVDLAVHSPDTWDQVMQLLSGKTVTALANLQAIVFGTAGGLFWLITKIRGRAIVSKDQLPSGNVRVTLADGTTIEGMAEAVALYERQSARESAREVVEPLHRPGVELLKFSGEPEAPELTIGEGDLSAFDTTQLDEEVLLDREEEVIVTIATASFAENYKWRFSEGDATFTASIEDPEFRARIDAGEPFRKGDMLRVQMRVVQTQRGNKLHVERTVLKVLHHFPREIQTQIEPGES